MSATSIDLLAIARKAGLPSGAFPMNAGVLVYAAHKNAIGYVFLARAVNGQSQSCRGWNLCTDERDRAIKDMKVELRKVHPDYRECAKKFISLVAKAVGSKP